MGYSRSTADDWSGYSRTVSAMPTAAIYKARGVDPSLDPKNIVVRESVDSVSNPNSTPLMVFVDQTGSMGELAGIIARSGLEKIMTQIYDKKPIEDPHILVGVIGDSSDGTEIGPLQATQFETDLKLVDQLEKLYLEHQGGGNGGESYTLAWYFAVHKTRCDAMTKRGRKGYLFTIGDESPLPVIYKNEIKQVFGDDIESNIKINDLYNLVCQNWEVFHLIVKPVVSQKPLETWRAVLGERAIYVDDYTKLGEVISAIIRANEGHKVDDIVKDWDGSTGIVVRNAIKGLTSTSNEYGVVSL